MEFVYRTFKDRDVSGILKNYMAAFCKSRFCQPSSRAFWEWKYGPKRPNYDPEGYQICEYKGKIVGTIMTTLRTMKFDNTIYKVAGIDDVATCPVLERRGIGKRLMENAIQFMKDRHVDLSILSADPRGHAKKIYWRAGYQYTTYLSVGVKFLGIKNALSNFTPGIPLALLFGLYGHYKSATQQHHFKKFESEFQIKILGENQETFRKLINRNYNNLYSFHDFDEAYWNWYHITRPPRYGSKVIALKEGKKIVAGGVITKSYLMFLNTKKWYPLYLLTELFVDRPYRKRGLGNYLLSHLERLAAREKVAMLISQFHERHDTLRHLLRRRGFLCFNKIAFLMLKPISERAKQHFAINQTKPFVWKVPWEQLGY
ncbi:MAG: GNAT family N-acetyltransferase [Candidatus Helarchaeota archaeon]